METAIITLKKTDVNIFTVELPTTSHMFTWGVADNYDHEDEGWDFLVKSYRKHGYKVITK